MEDFQVPEGHDFPLTGDEAERKFALSGFTRCLTGNKATQFAEIRAACGFSDDDSLLDVVLNPNVVTRIWFFQTASDYITQGEAHWATKA